MAAYLNRTISMVTGNGSSSSSSSSNGGSSSYDANALTDRQLHNAATDNSPLQIFVKAKKRINDIFGEIEEYVLEADRFIDCEYSLNWWHIELYFKYAKLRSSIIVHKNEAEIIDKAEAQEFQSYVHKVAGIREVLARDHMKVAFFGRTSNGKSSVINAMLREKILPSGIGHTTNCFCQVEGIDGKEAYLVKEDSDEKLNVIVRW